MKYIELFAGIGGFRSALDSQGHECVFASEIDKYATQAYKALYGGEELQGDITKVHAEDIPDHDLLVGGFPCQAFSIAGQRKGFEDTRGTLFYEIVRIADYKRPQWLMLENVKGLLSHDKGNTFEIMCATLNDIGYAIDFKVLNSKHYGVPQNRERVFIVASRDAEHEDWVFEGTDVSAKAKKRIQAMGVKTFNFDFPNNITVDKRLRDILQSDVPEKFYLSKEKTEKLIYQLNTKQEKEPQGEIVKLFDIPKEVSNEQELQRRVYGTEGVSPNICARTDYPKIAEPQVNVIGHADIKGMDIVKRVYDANGLSPTVTTCEGGHREPKIVVLGTTLDTGAKGTNYRSWVYDSNGLAHSITATEGKQPMQHMDSSFIETYKVGLHHIGEKTDLSHTLLARDYKGLSTYEQTGVVEYGLPIKEATKKGYEIATDGDSVNTVYPNSETRRGRVGKQIANTIETSCSQGVVNNYRIRKLTPLECFRLQGFADEQFAKLKQAGISDSQLYKMAGNAVTVNVIQALGKSLLQYDI